MNLDYKTYTVESVTSGHPDKICDQVSDAILDECIRQDPKSRVAIETFGSHGLFVIGGELTTTAEFNAEKIARKVYKQIGYRDKLKVITNIVKQSPDIAMGVDTGGAGDQGIMYGYATNETPEFLPLGVVLVHKLTKGLETLRKSKKIPWLMPDGKAQVTIKNGKVDTVLVSTQHKDSVTHEEIEKVLTQKLIKPIIKNIDKVKILINPTGKFVTGGFFGDTGLTGRKIMVDTYGGMFPHGGGCFSGKDPTKVDRSGAYMCRFVAKNLVAKKLAKRCLVSVSYAIGKAEPLMVEAIDEKGKSLASYVKKNYDFKPLSIIKNLNLRTPIFQNTASYGHFGREEFSWEKII
ncbi:methionine adenosyltransferase [Patescibacteria group bacterium]|nr:methionine adenosyltransferase [Patescibacteria group bacterium]MBU2036432.1 methionine adenosyltransferase [Patescibacteria group bacterium]